MASPLKVKQTPPKTPTPVERNASNERDSLAAASSAACAGKGLSMATTPTTMSTPSAPVPAFAPAGSAPHSASSFSTPPKGLSSHPVTSCCRKSTGSVIRYRRDGGTEIGAVAGRTDKPLGSEKLQQVPLGNGGVGLNNAYWWTQTLHDATLYLPLPASQSGRDLDVCITGSDIAIRSRSSPGQSYLSGSLPSSVRADPIWTLEGIAAGATEIRLRPLDLTQPPFGDDAVAPVSDDCPLFDACKLFVLSLEKVSPTWWRALIVGHPEIDATLVDSTQAISEYDDATQVVIRKIAFEQAQRRAGLPTSEEQAAAMEAAMEAPGGPLGPQ